MGKSYGENKQDSNLEEQWGKNEGITEVQKNGRKRKISMENSIMNSSGQEWEKEGIETEDEREMSEEMCVFGRGEEEV